MQDDTDMHPDPSLSERASLLKYHLPVPLTPLVGREREIAAISVLLSRPEVRLVSLTGTGGVGKTRLALKVAAASCDCADGICFVALAALTDPGLVASTIAQTLSVREQGSQPLLDTLKDHLRDKELLLLLDNFEQVVSAAPVVAELLAAVPRLHVLVTSRTSLHLSGEHEFVVPPLSLPDLRDLPPLDRLTHFEAVRLFIERARAVRSDFAMTAENAAAIAAICHHLEGLPLAIELAAGRSKLFSPRALLPRLRKRLKLLIGGAQDLPLRQQTLRNTIDWSYDLLDEVEKTLFRRVSVFVGGCTLEAAEAVCRVYADMEGDMVDLMVRLVDKSLLRQEAEVDGEPRLLMLETIREYALERLGESGKAEATRRRHAIFFLGMAEQAEPELHGPNQLAWIEQIELEHDNLRAALNWALEEVADDEQARERREMALRLSVALEAFWRIHGHYSEGRAFLERALVQSEGASAVLRAKVLGATASVAFWQGDLDRAEVLARQSLSLSRELENTQGIDKCLYLLGYIAWTRGKTVEAITLSEERIRLIQQGGQPGVVADALFSLAFEICVHGEYTRGLQLFEEALVLYQTAGNELRVGATLVESAWWLLSTLGDGATIRRRLQQGQALINKVGDRYWSAMTSVVASLVALSEGETARAFSLIKEGLAIFREMDAQWYLALTLQSGQT